MTEQKKRPRNRNRNRGTQPAGELATQPVVSVGSSSRAVDSVLQPMPDWKWKTFPVFFALSFGLMIGVYFGWVAGFIASDRGNQTPTTVTFIVAALLFGFALSRYTTRWVVSRRWVKARSKR